MANISPQATWSVPVLPDEIAVASSDRFNALEPEYAQFIDPKNIRRMSRIIKFGVSAATLALREAKVTIPDAIITGTGYGCLEDTGTFLSRMIENNEVALNPTPFIQSTHNTIGSQIALLLQCQGYNQTYAHGAFSFESTLLDAIIQAEEAPEKNILLGGVDEITDVSHAIQKRFGIFRDAVNGEGAAFFVAGGDRVNAIAAIESVNTFYKPDDSHLRSYLQSLEGVDLVLLGTNTKQENDALIKMLPTTAVGYFKHLSGEYPVASAFAVWLAATVLRSQVIPSAICVKGELKSIKKILILNSYFDTHYSAIVMSAC